MRVLQYLRLAPIIVGEHYRVFLPLENLTKSAVTNLKLECSINVKLSGSVGSTPSISQVEKISGKGI